jgi:hypothetical protein
MKDFQITLKNEKRTSYKKSLLVIIVLNLLAFIILASYAPDALFRNKCLVAIAIILISFVADPYWKNSQKINSRVLAVFLIVFIYFLLHLYIPALAMIGITFLYLVSMRPLIVYCSEQEIIYPSFPKRIISWSELHNILLKDELLTIDFKNNRLIQQYIEADLSRVNEKEFNDFCNQQMKK